MAKPRVFISRDLKVDSIFQQGLEKAGFEVYGESLIAFSPVELKEFPDTDWIFFYSGQAVTYFFEGLHRKALSLKPQLKLAALGPGTAAKLVALGLSADFIGAGKPAEVATQFLAIARGQKVLFPRAIQSKKSIQKALAGKIIAYDLVAYQNEIRQDFTIPRSDYLVFTSPMNAKAFFMRYLSTEAISIAIGETTAQALRDLGQDEVHIAASPSEAHLVELILGVGGMRNEE